MTDLLRVAMSAGAISMLACTGDYRVVDGGADVVSDREATDGVASDAASLDATKDADASGPQCRPFNANCSTAGQCCSLDCDPQLYLCR